MTKKELQDKWYDLYCAEDIEKWDKNKKMSKYLEMTLEAYCESSGQPNPLNKGEFYKLMRVQTGELIPFK